MGSKQETGWEDKTKTTPEENRSRNRNKYEITNKSNTLQWDMTELTEEIKLEWETNKKWKKEITESNVQNRQRSQQRCSFQI